MAQEDHVGTVSIIFSVAMIVITFFVLCIFLILYGGNRRETPNIQAGSIMIGHAFFSLVLYAGGFHMYGMLRTMSAAMCWIYGHLEIMYQIYVPFSLFAFTIERFIYIRDPVGYTQKLSKIAIIILVAFPWVFSFILTCATVISTTDQAITLYSYKEYDFTHDNSSLSANDSLSENTYKLHNPSNRTFVVCYLKGNDSFYVHHYLIGITMLIAVLFSFICTITVLVMWCCYRCRHARGTDYGMMGDDVVSAVKQSVICISIVNASFFVFCMLVNIFFLGLVSLYTLFGIVEGITFLSCFRNVRQTIAHCCCYFCRKGSRREPPPVTFQSENEDI